MNETREVLRQLARESGRLLGELGVRPEDREWIDAHAETIASLGGDSRRRWPRWLYRLARKAARTAR
ncbi:MAG: hypothetical protein ABR576_05670 [Thermoanaerobaculia bacterium]